MLEIMNTEICGVEAAVMASGYPMRIEPITENEKNDTNILHNERNIKRAVKLGNVPTGSGHDIYLKGIVVQFDVKYSQYWSMQFQRYHFADIVSSQSKLHRITKMDISASCNKYVEPEAIALVEKWIKIYNEMENDSRVSLDLYDSSKKAGYCIFKELEIGDDFAKGLKWFNKYEVFMKIISNTPMGFEMTMRVVTNYLQLKTIYAQRKNDKLKEDWGYFCNWCEKLPYFKEFCLKNL